MLQNGENIFTLQLGFPFRSTLQPENIRPPFSPLGLSRWFRLTISAAGWTRATVGGSLRCRSFPVGKTGVQGPSLRLGW